MFLKEYDDINQIPTTWSDYAVNEKFMGVGPMMFANHHCNPNVEFWYHEEYVGEPQFAYLIATNIPQGSEILYHYGDEYFTDGDCLCSQMCTLRKMLE